MRKSILAVVATLGFVAALILSVTYGHSSGVPADAAGNAARADDGADAILRVDWVRLPSKSSERGDDDDAAEPSQHQSSGGNGQVTIVEYEDFQCPVCAAAAPTVDMVAQKYGDQVTIEHRDYPLSYHANAMEAAVAVRCADEQGAADQFRTALYENQADLSRAGLEQLAGKVGIDERKFDACLDGGRYDAAVKADIAEGNRARVGGTPTFVINGRAYAGALSFEEFQKIIDADLASASGR
jgi:protein-disulfide isomerase